MKAIILAAGRGTRLPNSARDIPKVLVDIAGKPVLQRQIDLLEKHGINNICVSLGVKAQAAIAYLDGRYSYVDAGAALGTAGNIRYALRDDASEPFLVLNGDVLTDLDISDLIKTYKESGAHSLLAAYYANDVRDYGYMQFEDAPLFNSHDKLQLNSKIRKITAFLEKPKSEYQVSGYLNAGIYIFRPETFLKLKKGMTHSSEIDIFPELVRQGNLYAYIHSGWWREMGTEERLAALRAEIENL